MAKSSRKRTGALRKLSKRAKRPVRTKQTRRTSRERLIASFSYFETPDELGGEGEFSLALDESYDRLVAAAACTTWGQFARVLGVSWATFVRTRDEELADVFQDDTPRATTPLDFAELWWGKVAIACNGFPDPREAGYDFLTENVPGDVFLDSRLDGWLEWGGSSPGGNLDTVTSRDAEGFVRLQEVLHGAGFTGLKLKQSEYALVIGS